MVTSATPLAPCSPAELADAVRSTPRAIVVGGGTKPRLAAVSDEFVRISTAKLSGIVEYEPSEFTFTALAGTPLRELGAALAERGQYLPFEPTFAESGATLGGTVAAGMSGAGRYRYGGLRDFILGVRFVDGEGRLLRLGGKVVKNAAGFDLPKFLAGSAGRFGALADVTFKVFPRPIAQRTLRIEAKDAAAKARIMMELARGRWELDAIDAAVEEAAVFARLGGPPESLDALAAEIVGRMPGAAMPPGDADHFWRTLREFRWAHSGGTLIKSALLPQQVPEFIALVRGQAGARGWISAGGNAGCLSAPKDFVAPALPWPAVTLRGEAALWPGIKPRFEIMARVKQALDPVGRFPALDD